MEYWYTWERKSFSYIGGPPFMAFGASSSYPEGEVFNLTKEPYEKRNRRRMIRKKVVVEKVRKQVA